jgi:ABC-type sugar transport system permease subunit
MSLWRWGVKAESFVGFANYARLFREEVIARDWAGNLAFGELGQSLIVTGYYTLFTVPVALFISFLIAVALFQKLKGRDLIRTVFFLPFVTSQVAAAMVFRWIYHPQVGVANAVLIKLGLPPQSWLLDGEPVLRRALQAVGIHWLDKVPDLLAGPSLALVAVILFAIWSSLGFDIAIFLSALGQVPRELYDAARVDGANRWHLLRHVTVPVLSPTIFFLLIVSVIRSFQSFSSFYALVGAEGAPLGSTLSMTVAIFHNFYEKPSSVGYAAAFSFILFGIILLLSLIQFRVLGRKVHYNGS